MTPDDLARLERQAERGDDDLAAIVKLVIDVLKPWIATPSWIEVEEMAQVTQIDRRWFIEHKDEMGVPYYRVSHKVLRWDRAAFLRWMERQRAG
jgi:hypothetical protein